MGAELVDVSRKGKRGGCLLDGTRLREVHRTWPLAFTVAWGAPEF